MRILLFLLFLITTGLSAQTQYYVSPGGNNANAGTLLSPWRTIQHALDNSVPGCTIFLMGGTYSENAIVNVSGTVGSSIILTNYNNQNAVIDGSASTGGPLLYINGKNYITVKGIEFSNYSMNDAQGILVEGVCDHVEILDNKIHNIHFSSNASDIPNAGTNAQPLIVYGDDATNAITNLLISGNEIYNCRTGFSEALAVNGNVDGFIISGNKVHSNSNIGIDLIGHEGVCTNPSNDQARNGVVKWNKTWNNVSPYATSAGIYVDGARNCVIENNVSYGNGWGIEIGCESVNNSSSNISVRSNLVYHNLEGGIIVGGYDYPGNSGKVISTTVTNNSIIDNNIGPSNSGEIVENYTENCFFTSNLVYSSGTDLLFSSDFNSPSSTYNFNLYYSTIAPEWSFNGITANSISGWEMLCGDEAASIYADPQLVNISASNFHLQSSSPAIDMGDSTYLVSGGETDIDTMNRVQNGRVDIGADEYGTAVGIVDLGFSQGELLFYDFVGSDLKIYFSGSQMRNSTIYLYDSSGKIIESKKVRKGDSAIGFNATNLAQGIYFARLNESILKIIK